MRPRHRALWRRSRASLALAARVARVIATAVFAAAICTSSFADAPGEVHGSGDAYAASGVTLAWGILHGADESSTQVVIRVAADPQRYPMISAVGKNPFGGQERVLLAATATADSLEVRVPRSQFADFPRTELRFYSGAAAAASQTPALIVYYLGVPDTTPELADERKLDAYLGDRITRARAAAGTAKTP
jgi:hypothetical protein